MGLPRPQRPGSALAALSEAFDAAGRTAVAQDLCVDPSTLSRWCAGDDEGGRAMSWRVVDQLCRLHPDTAAPAIARHAAGLAGGVFVPCPPVDGDLGRAGAALAAETSEACGALMEALGPASALPGALTEAEKRRVAAELDDVIAAATRLRAHCAAPVAAAEEEDAA